MNGFSVTSMEWENGKESSPSVLQQTVTTYGKLVNLLLSFLQCPFTQNQTFPQYIQFCSRGHHLAKPSLILLEGKIDISPQGTVQKNYF